MPHTIFGLDPLVVATTLLVLTYGAIVTDRINRAVVALLGAGLMIVTGILSQEEAIRGVDFNTIGLLAGMMLIVGITRRSGVFEYVAIWSAKAVKANPAGVLALLSIVTAVASALWTTSPLCPHCPCHFDLPRAKVPPYPFLFNQIIASNIGGTATLIGDPPNIIIGSAANLAFDQFVVHLAPVIVVIMAVQVLITHLVWGRKLHATPEDRARVMAMDERAAITDWKLRKQALACWLRGHRGVRGGAVHRPSARHDRDVRGGDPPAARHAWPHQRGADAPRARAERELEGSPCFLHRAVHPRSGRAGRLLEILARSSWLRPAAR
jgi:Na+/H+ antiporter NhaD/arsenite permease-like protein